MSRIQLAGFNQRPQSGIFCRCNPCQPLSYDDTVFIFLIHDIADRCDCRKFRIFFKIRLVQSQFLI